MPDLPIDIELLKAFEKGLDPRFPERGPVPARVLGYGEMTTVLEIGEGAARDLAYKRMPMLENAEEVKQYEGLHHEYIRLLRDEAGIQVIPCEILHFQDERRGRPVVYIVQRKVPAETMGHRAIHGLQEKEIGRLVHAALRETLKIFDYNLARPGGIEIGFDGQISNWAIMGGAGPEAPISLSYLDTSTPLIRKDGKEQLDPELFLRSAPSYLVWIIRLLFLKDVLTRYYDFRKVAIDLLANFYKEQRPDLIPGLLEVVNGFFEGEAAAHRVPPITADEVRAYYREDIWIWRTYLAFRKIDRFLHRLTGRDYRYILPPRIKR